MTLDQINDHALYYALDLALAAADPFYLQPIDITVARIGVMACSAAKTHKIIGTGLIDVPAQWGWPQVTD